MAQYDGMQTGLELAGVALPGHWRWLLNGIGDLFQIVPAVEPSRRTNWDVMSREQKRSSGYRALLQDATVRRHLAARERPCAHPAPPP